jgi:hypothetical protein
MINLLTKLIEWAKRDNVCAAALLLGLAGVFPHAIESFTFFFQNALIPLVQAATGAK